MATFGSYNNTASPRMKWYADYSYSRSGNDTVSVTVTVYGEIINHAQSSYMGTSSAGNATLTVQVTVGGATQSAVIKDSGTAWRGNTNNPRSCSFSFAVPSSAAGQTIGVAYQVVNGGSSYTAPGAVPKQSTSFASPALLYTASTITASASGNALSVAISRQRTDMTHTVTYARGSNTVSHTGCTTSDGYTVPASWITDNSGGYINVSCATYIGSTYVGTTSTSVWCTVPDSVVPTITGTAYTITDGKFGGALAGVSKIQWNASASGADGSWITESYISGGGYTVALNGQTGALYNAGDNPFTIYAKDSRGRTCSATVTVSVTAYSRPSVTVQSTQHCLEDGTISDEGGYLSCMGTATYDAVSGQNTATYQLWYRKVGDDAWSAAVTWTPGTATVIGDGEISPDSSYEVWYQAQDQVATAYYIDTVLHKRRIIDAYEDGAGVQSVGIGGAALEDGKTTVYNPLTCLSPVQLSGGQWVHSAVGTSGVDGYVKFAEIKIIGTYVNMGLTMDVIQRTYTAPVRIGIRFAGGNTTDPALAAIEVSGDHTAYWIKKESTGTWGLYAQKVEAYDRIDVVGYHFPTYLHNGVQVTWTDTPIDSIDGATQATKVGGLGFEVPRAGAFNNAGSLSAFEASHASFVGSIYTDTWYNMISCRHRNNADDGVNYGMALFAPLFGGNLQWHQQTGAGTWGADRTIWDSGNSLQTSSGGGNDSAYVRIGNMQICWGTINITMNISTATGNSYYGEWSGDHAFAAPFNSGCWPNISLLSESTLVKSVGLEQRSYAGIQKILAFDSRPRTNQQFYVHYIACGWV